MTTIRQFPRPRFCRKIDDHDFRYDELAGSKLVWIARDRSVLTSDFDVYKYQQAVAKTREVYEKARDTALVAVIPVEIARATGYDHHRAIWVKQDFFNKIIQSHFNQVSSSNLATVDMEKLLEFVLVLHNPDQVRQSRQNSRLYFIKELPFNQNHLVVVDKNNDPGSELGSLVNTSFKIKQDKPKRKKYVSYIKNTSTEVFSGSGRTPSGYPSSNMLAQVPGAGGR